MLTANDFGIKRAIHEYVLSMPPLVPVAYEPEPPHITSGMFGARNIAKCPRADYYERGWKNKRLPFDPLPFPLKSAWSMYAGNVIEQLVVLPALHASGRYKVLDAHREVLDKVNERRGVTDPWVLDQQTGHEIIIEVKNTTSLNFARYKRKDEKAGKLPATEHWLAQAMWYYWQTEKKDNLRVALIEIARDHIGFTDEYIAVPEEGKVYKLRGDGKGVQEYDLPAICTAAIQGQRARQRLECWQVRRLPPPEPSYPKWECDYCSFVGGCKGNINITEVKDDNTK